MSKLQFPQKIAENIESGKVRLEGNYRDIPLLMGEDAVEQSPRKEGEYIRVDSYHLARALQGRSALDLRFIQEFEGKYKEDSKFQTMLGDLVDQIYQSDFNNDGWVTQLEAAQFYSGQNDPDDEESKVFNAVEVMYYGSLVTSYLLSENFKSRSFTEGDGDRLVQILRFTANQLDNHYPTEVREETSFNGMGIQFMPTNISEQEFDIEKAVREASQWINRESRQNPEIAANLELILRSIKLKPNQDKKENYYYEAASGAPLTPAEIRRVGRNLEEKLDEGGGAYLVDHSYFIGPDNATFKTYKDQRVKVFDAGFKKSYPDQMDLADKFGDMLIPLQAKYGHLIDSAKVFASLDKSLTARVGTQHLTLNEKNLLRELMGQLDLPEEIRISICANYLDGNAQKTCLDLMDTARTAVDAPLKVATLLATIVVGISVIKKLALDSFKRELIRIGCTDSQVEEGVEKYREYVDNNLITKMAEGRILAFLLGVGFTTGAGIYRGTDTANYFDYSEMSIMVAAALMNKLLIGGFMRSHPDFLAGCTGGPDNLSIPKDFPVPAPGVEPVVATGPYAPKDVDGNEIMPASFDGSTSGMMVYARATSPVPVSVTVSSAVPSHHMARNMSGPYQISVHATPSGSRPNPTNTILGVGSILGSGINITFGLSVSLDIYDHLDLKYADEIGYRDAAISLRLLRLVEEKYLGASSGITGWAMRKLYPIRAGYLIGRDNRNLWKEAQGLYLAELNQAEKDLSEMSILIQSGKFPDEHGNHVSGEEAYAVFLEMCMRKDLPKFTEEELALLEAEENSDQLKSNPKLHYKLLCHSLKSALKLGYMESQKSGSGFVGTIGGAVEPGSSVILGEGTSRMGRFVKDHKPYGDSILSTGHRLKQYKIGEDSYPHIRDILRKMGLSNDVDLLPILEEAEKISNQRGLSVQEKAIHDAMAEAKLPM